MKVNTIVLLLQEGIVRVGVIASRVTTERLDHTVVNATVRLPPTKAAPRNLVQIFEPILVEFKFEEDRRHDPLYSLLLRSDDYSSAVSYAEKIAAKPTDDPDEIPF